MLTVESHQRVSRPTLRWFAHRCGRLCGKLAVEAGKNNPPLPETWRLICEYRCECGVLYRLTLREHLD
jgi:hypothetical protein